MDATIESWYVCGAIFLIENLAFLCLCYLLHILPCHLWFL